MPSYSKPCLQLGGAAQDDLGGGGGGGGLQPPNPPPRSAPVMVKSASFKSGPLAVKMRFLLGEAAWYP